MRLMRYEYRRYQHACLHQGNRRCTRTDEDLSTAASASGEGSGARSEELLCAICLDRAVVADVGAYPRKGVAAVARGSRQARRHVRMHPLRVLFDLLPKLLVEFGSLPWSGRAAAGKPLGTG